MNPFKILNIPDNSTKSVAQQAYRRLAMQLHPDRNTAPDAEAKFKLIKEAWEMIDSGYIENIIPIKKTPQTPRRKSPAPQYAGWQGRPDIPKKQVYNTNNFNSMRTPPTNQFKDLVEDVIGNNTSAFLKNSYLIPPRFNDIPQRADKKPESFLGDFTANITEENYETGYQVDIQVENARYNIMVPPNTEINLPKKYKVPAGYVTITPKLTN